MLYKVVSLMLQKTLLALLYNRTSTKSSVILVKSQATLIHTRVPQGEPSRAISTGTTVFMVKGKTGVTTSATIYEKNKTKSFVILSCTWQVRSTDAMNENSVLFTTNKFGEGNRGWQNYFQ